MNRLQYNLGNAQTVCDRIVLLIAIRHAQIKERTTVNTCRKVVVGLGECNLVEENVGFDGFVVDLDALVGSAGEDFTLVVDNVSIELDVVHDFDLLTLFVFGIYLVVKR